MKDCIAHSKVPLSPPTPTSAPQYGQVATADSGALDDEYEDYDEDDIDIEEAIAQLEESEEADSGECVWRVV